MTLYYALGGGLGHLTRARAVLHTLGIAPPVTLLTVEGFNGDRRVVGDNDILAVPEEVGADPAACRAWLSATIEARSPDVVFLDTFPAGILGELCGLGMPAGVPLIHIARLLRWGSYRPLLAAGGAPRADVTYVVEKLTPEHDDYLRSHSGQIVSLALSDPPNGLPASLAGEIAAQLSPEQRPLWLVVHSGPAEEIDELVGYGLELAAIERSEPAMAVISPLSPPPLPPGIGHLDLYPATPLFPFADRIITACGFNIMRQTEPFRDRHRFLPFPRRYDDQFLRASRGRR